MERVWLIQRGTVRDIPKHLVTGIDSIIEYDYMGAAEFEWGALPKSLYRILKNIQQYTFCEIDIKDFKGNNMKIFCKKEDIDEASINALYLAEGKLHPYISGLSKKNFWWDIQNDFMIMFGEDSVEKLNIALENMLQKDYFDKIKNIAMGR
jgi:hypothetical protein